MDRRKFINTTCIACVSGFAVSSLLQSCEPTRIITASIKGSDLIIPLSEFQIKKNNSTIFKKYVVAQNDQLQFPVCVYRFDESNYSAIYMRCTHQGAELQVFGDKLQCPAHGSEFTNKGVVMNHPATENLRTFPVTILNDQIKISLI